MRFLGIDGCKAGWLVFGLQGDGRPAADPVAICRSIDSLFDLVQASELALIDMPIGLSDSSYRVCDTLARRRLGKMAHSVFLTPVRAAIYAADYTSAVSTQQTIMGKGISRQSWGIAGSIRSVDEALQGCGHEFRSERLLESHPELCFAALNGNEPMRWPKREYFGARDRLASLEPYVPGMETLLEKTMQRKSFQGASGVDVLDAAALAVHARLVSINGADFLPANPPKDSCGLPMRMAVGRASAD
jgi:predicted RNase H-like nuclease